ncbi:MAG: hypothetical protein QNJ44_07045 [Rhodobacter sp.]|nr:hypothetical protein [Rhodobacter sp.]
MTRSRLVISLLVLWLAIGVAAGVHLAVTEPVAQMPVHGFNKLVIGAAWFGVSLLVILAAAIAGYGLPKESTLRPLAFVLLGLQLCVVILVAAQIRL